MKAGRPNRVLLPMDGSKCSNRALDYLIEQSGYCNFAEIHVLNVQSPLSGNASSFISREKIAGYHREQGEKALKPARRKLDAAQLDYRCHIGVGDPAEVIARYAKEKKCDQLVMGTRGLGSVSGLVLGSVATKVIHLSPAVVTLVK